MADDVQITQGSGTTVATDDVAGVHYQRVKLVDGTADGTTPIPGGAGGLLVDLGSNNDVTVTGTVTADAGTGFAPVVTDGSAAGTTGTHVLGTDGTNAQILSTNASGHVNIADGGNVITVDGTVTATATDLDIRDLSSATDSVTVAQATAGNLNATVVGTVTANAGSGPFPVSDNAGSLTVDAPAGTPVFTRLSDGAAALTTTGGRLSVDASGVAVPVTDNASSLTVDQATASSLNAQVVGPTAADAAITANPVTVGARASTANPTSVSADGDVVNIWANRMGAQVITMAPHVGLNGSPWTLTSTSAQYTTTQTSTALVTVGATTQVVVTSIQIQAYGTTAFTCQVYFGTGAFSRGTTPAVFDGEFAPSATNKPGVVMQGPFMGAADADLRITTNTTGSVTVTVWYYTVG